MASPRVHTLPRDRIALVHDNGRMDGEVANHLKAWRKYRRMTQQQLADAVDPPTSKQVIQALESGQNGLSDKWLRRLAPALGTTPGFLLDYDPEQIPTDILDIWRDIPAEDQDRARRALEIFRKTGTHG